MPGAGPIMQKLRQRDLGEHRLYRRLEWQVHAAAMPEAIRGDP